MPKLDDIKFSGKPQRNRIEEMLRQAPPASSYGGEPTMPALQKTEPAYEAHRADKTDRSYGRFLQKFFLGLVVIVLIVVVGLGGYATFQNYKHPKAGGPDQTIAEVGKLVALPQGETPTIATISDLKPLASQEFFKDAQIGDKVLVYNTAKKAILYRPSEHKVINVAPLGDAPTQ